MVRRRLLSRAVRDAAARIAFDPSPTIKDEIARLPSAADKRKQPNCGELSNSPREPTNRALLRFQSQSDAKCSYSSEHLIEAAEPQRNSLYCRNILWCTSSRHIDNSFARPRAPPSACMEVLRPLPIGSLDQARNQ